MLVEPGGLPRLGLGNIELSLTPVLFPPPDALFSSSSSRSSLSMSMSMDEGEPTPLSRLDCLPLLLRGELTVLVFTSSSELDIDLGVWGFLPLVVTRADLEGVTVS